MSTWEPSSAVSTMLSVSGYAAIIVTVVLLVLLLLVSCAIYRTEQQCKHIPAPKRESFFFGNISTLTTFKKRTGLPLMTLLYKFTKDYGQLFWIRVLWKRHFFATSPEVVKELLLNSRHTKPWELYKTFHSVFGERFMGGGLVSQPNHEKWHHRRALMNPVFHRRYLIRMMDQFNEGADALCQQLLERADGKTEVALLDELNNVTLDVIAKIGFSLNTDALGNPTCPFPLAVSTALKGMQSVFDNPFVNLDPRSEKRKFRTEVRNAIKLIREMGRKCIQERIAARQRGDYVPSDMLSLILEASGDLMSDKNFGMEEILDEFATLFVGGQETTSNLLAYTLIQLGRNPEVAIKLQAEVDEVLGQKPDIQYEDLAKLEYMMRVIKETLRLYPPVGGTTRVTAHEIQCNGYTIPAGVNVSVMSNVMARMEEYFDDPLLFNPDRFKSTGELPRHLYAYFPFSMGQRSCIGQQFALIEARVILGKLLQRFAFRLEQSQRFDMLDELTAKPLDRCKNYITLRA